MRVVNEMPDFHFHIFEFSHFHIRFHINLLSFVSCATHQACPVLGGLFTSQPLKGLSVVEGSARHRAKSRCRILTIDHSRHFQVTGNQFFPTFVVRSVSTATPLLKIYAMPSFDIVSKVDAQALDNAVNVTTKEITNRFDFKGSHVEIKLDKKEFKINIETDDDMKMRQLIDVLISRAHKQNIAPEAFDLSKESYQSGKLTKQEVSVRNGLKQEDAKKVVKLIKDSGLKVQVSINDDMVRVTAKKIDDLQEVIKLCRGAELGIPLQYENMRS
jgi:uncharacterized protein YajQ (UPF0234 family)